jgi:hypothetical protein
VRDAENGAAGLTDAKRLRSDLTRCIFFFGFKSEILRMQKIRPWGLWMIVNPALDNLGGESS